MPLHQARTGASRVAWQRVNNMWTTAAQVRVARLEPTPRYPDPHPTAAWGVLRGVGGTVTEPCLAMTLSHEYKSLDEATPQRGVGQGLRVAGAARRNWAVMLQVDWGAQV
ncbi:hypothetical protein E2C01_062987 [Portunus trituberculatus]|uniref:Uncharacterized protein n=1 Tax=Portunus trituberculatus TaxID=210409 RepID=A0A5B7HHK1_PORTR|nr:hypothetical protein [Portunus trituberculatus]